MSRLGINFCEKLQSRKLINAKNILMEINWCEREKPKYEENSIQPKRKFAQFEPEGFSPRAQIEQIFSAAGWNFLNIAVSPKDTSLFTIYNTN